MKEKTVEIENIVINSASYAVFFLFFELLYFLFSVNSIYSYIIVFITGLAGTAGIIFLSVMVYLRKNAARFILLVIYDIHFPATLIYYILNFGHLPDVKNWLFFYYHIRILFSFLEIFFIIYLSKKSISKQFS